MFCKSIAYGLKNYGEIMNTSSQTKKSAKKPVGQTLRHAFKGRQEFAMLLLGFASGIPYVVIGGVLNAWLTTAGVKLSSIGILSWIILAYTFKYMWAAALQSHRTPFKLSIGPRRFWMFLFLGLSVVGLVVLSFAKPPDGLRFIGYVGIIIAVFSASFDIVQAAWKIESAKDDRHLDLLCTIEQLGYRFSSFVVGAGALVLADFIGWQLTFIAAAAVLGMCIFGIILAAPSPVSKIANENSSTIILGAGLPQGTRNFATIIVLICWAIALYILGSFMFGALGNPESYSSRDFIRYQAPIVVTLTVLVLGVISAVLLFICADEPVGNATQSVPKSSVLDIFYLAILHPMMDIISRLRWASILILFLILSYRFTDLIWGSFAYPFYMGENYGALGHSLTEVGLASKTTGVIATILGIGVGGLAMLKFGRMPVMLVGAFFAAITNLLFADLALGAHYMDGFLGFTQLDHFFALFRQDLPMARLITAIFAENLAVGVASVASVAFLSSIVNKEYAATQYALLVSLTFLIGVLGRGRIGEIIEAEGFATAFILCAWLGSVAVVLTALEWYRQVRAKRLKIDLKTE